MSNPAQGYESFMVPTLFAPWATRLVQTANLRSGERVLDLACGTGIVAREVARLGAGTITGLDISPHMLDVARGISERDGLAIDWHEGRAEELPFDDGAFDVVLCQFALMFFANRSAALGEVHRVLADRGRLFLNVWQGLDRHPFYQTLHTVIEKRIGISALADIFSLSDHEELRALVEGAGFTGVEIEPVSLTARFPNPEGFLAGEIDVDTAAIPSMQRLDADARQKIIAAITADMERPLREATRDAHVVIPFHAYMVRATR